MNKQKTFTGMEYAQRKRTGRRKKFPDATDVIIPWTAFEETVKPFYPKSGLRGSQPKETELMLRMYFPRVRFNLADGENIYHSRAMGKFTRPDYSREDAPGAAALPHFRHPHGEHDPRKELFRTLNGIPEKNGKITRGCTIADAAIIEAPSPAENSVKSRYPEMKPAQKGNLRHSGMKAYIDVDAGTGMARGAGAIGENVHDLEAVPKLIRPDDDFVNIGAGYTGIKNERK
jgi:IS5 family transposase